jgi:hypothetical protein
LKSGGNADGPTEQDAIAKYNVDAGASERQAKELRAIEKTYRLREEEIIRTLETVVSRCKDLEGKLGLRAAATSATQRLQQPASEDGHNIVLQIAN